MTTPSKPKSWRSVLPIHPAALKMPPYSEVELRDLGDDIKRNGLVTPITIFEEVGNVRAHYSLLDGINRLDAMEMVGIPIRLVDGFKLQYCSPATALWCPFKLAMVRSDWPHGDPYTYVISANIHRRHLTAEKKRELIAEVIKANPEKSDRQIAGQIKASPSTVGKVRKEMEQTGDVSNLDTRTDRRGREQPAHKAPSKPGVIAEPPHEPPQAVPKPVKPNAIDDSIASRLKAGEATTREQFEQEAHRLTRPQLEQEVRALLDMVHRLSTRGVWTPAMQAERDQLEAEFARERHEHAATRRRLQDALAARDEPPKAAQWATTETKPPKVAEPPPEMVECPKCHGTGNMDDDGIPEFLRRQSS